MNSQAARKAAVRFRERSELLDFLLEVSDATAATLDLDQLLANVAEIIQRVLPYEVFAILLFNERRHDLRIRYAVGHREEIIQNLSVALGEGVTGTAAVRREPVLVGDVRNDPRYLNTIDAVRTEMAVPMTARGRLVGELITRVSHGRRLPMGDHDPLVADVELVDAARRRS